MPLPVDLIKKQLLQLLDNTSPEQRAHLVSLLKQEGWLVSFQKVAPYSGLRWIKSRLLLKQWNKTLLHLRENAKNQIAILDAFEKKKWKPTIYYGDYSMHLFGQRMHDTLARLNKYQSVIKFKYSGKRRDPHEEHVRWRSRNK